MLFDKISDSLNVENLAITPSTVVDNPESSMDNTSMDVNIEADYVHTRSSLYTLAEKLNGLIDTSIAIAEASETPRAFEVAGDLVKAAVELNLSITKLNRETKQLRGLSNSDNKTTNNNLFVGSTADLLRFINKTK